MKVLQVNSVIGFGSTGRIMASLAEVVRSHGDECVVCYGRQDLSNNSVDAIRIGNKLDYLTHAISTRLFDNHGLSSKLATRKFIKRIKEIKPDLIHIHNIHGYYINYEIFFKLLKKADIPVVWTLHDCWPYTGHCSYYTYRKCMKWKQECHHCIERNFYPESFLFDRSKEMYRRKKKAFNGINNLTIVTPSKWLKGDVEESFLKYPCKAIPNGIDLSKFFYEENRTYDFKGKKIILALTSYWFDRKGLDIVYELANKLDDNYQVVIVGLNKEQMKQAPKNVYAIERTRNLDELRQLYSAAYYYINPSLEDNFPTTNLESMACGTPIIAFNIGGTAEVVNEKVGYSLDEATSDAILDVIVNKPYNFKRDEIIKEGQKFEDKKCFEEYYQLYKEILAKK